MRSNVPGFMPRSTAPASPNCPRLLTPEDVAQRLGISVACVRDHCTRRRPLLPSMKVFGVRRFHPEDFERWFEAVRMAGLRRAT